MECLLLLASNSSFERALLLSTSWPH